MVEGYLDVISLNQGGIANTVAALGTAFNDEHVRVLKKYADTVTIFFDSDNAGEKAALRAIPFLTESGLRVKVLQAENAKDPDEFITKYGAQALLDVLPRAKSHFTFEINCLKKQYNMENPDDKVVFTTQAAKLLAKVSSSIELDVYIKETSSLTGISEKAITEEIEKIKRTTQAGWASMDYTQPQKMPLVGNNKSRGAKTPQNDKGINEARKNLIYLIATEESVFRAVKEHIMPEELVDEVYVRLLEKIYALYDQGKEIYPGELISGFYTAEEQKRCATVFATNKNFASEQIFSAVNDFLIITKKAYIDHIISNERDLNKISSLAKMKSSLQNLKISL